MLIFNKNIYQPRPDEFDPLHLENEDSPNFNLDPYDLLLTVLSQDRRLFIGLERMDKMELDEKMPIIFPNASRFGDLDVLNQLSKRLLEGLVDQSRWYGMNSYHACYLYDALFSMVEDYSYSDIAERLEIFPDHGGEAIDLNSFINEYFLNTLFLVHPDRFDKLSPDELEERYAKNPCLFGVVNRLTPSPEEIQLTQHATNPYEPE